MPFLSSCNAIVVLKPSLLEPMPWIRSHKGRFGFTQLFDSHPIKQLSQKTSDLSFIANLIEDSIITDNKLEKINALYTKWKYEDTKRLLNKLLNENALKTC